MFRGDFSVGVARCMGLKVCGANCIEHGKSL